MSRVVGTMQQEASGLTVTVYEGWSWPVFFVGPIWHLVKGLWGIGLLWLVIAVATVGAGWILGLAIMPAIANKQYREHLGANGYRMVTPTGASRT
jgi:hypothetical protein